MNKSVEIQVSKFFYTRTDAPQFVCCDELQDTLFCYKSNIAQGCQFCETDPYSPCECAVCEK